MYVCMCMYVLGFRTLHSQHTSTSNTHRILRILDLAHVQSKIKTYPRRGMFLSVHSTHDLKIIKSYDDPIVRNEK